MKFFLMMLFGYLLVYSAPARTTLQEFKNHDGSIFFARAKGTHLLNWIETLDGEILKYNAKTQDFEYAKIENNRLIPSGMKYQKENSKRARSLVHINKIFFQDLKKLWKLQNIENAKRKKIHVK